MSPVCLCFLCLWFVPRLFFIRQSRHSRPPGPTFSGYYFGTDRDRALAADSMARLVLHKPFGSSHYLASVFLTAFSILCCTRNWFRLGKLKLWRKSSGSNLRLLQSAQPGDPEPPELLIEQLSRSTHFLSDEGQARKDAPVLVGSHTGWQLPHPSNILWTHRDALYLHL